MKKLKLESLTSFLEGGELITKNYLKTGVCFVLKSGMVYRFMRAQHLWVLYEKHPKLDYMKMQNQRVITSKNKKNEEKGL
jgi:hypothetical protein